MDETDRDNSLCNTLAVCIGSPKSEAFGGKNPVHMLFWMNYTP
jgi:hypothetical protein